MPQADDRKHDEPPRVDPLPQDVFISEKHRLPRPDDVPSPSPAAFHLERRPRQAHGRRSLVGHWRRLWRRR